MLFNSYEFVLVFLPATLVLFFSIARYSPPAARRFLLAASFAFYAWWSVEYGLLIVATVVVNYSFGLRIQYLAQRGASAARGLLIAAVALNLALLGYFKYRNFFVENVNELTGANWPIVSLVLPLAISFHTFQQIAYLVDSWRGKVDQPTLIDYGLFVLFFPQLIAGPIVHHWQLLPQFKEARFYRFDYTCFAAGLTFFVLGLAKKLLIADPLATVSDPIFNAATTSPPSLAEAWMGVAAYTLGLYFDFSGYSDMAIGLARMFGIRLPYNFDSPYQATSIIDFWRRWHITLSNWLRDYLYVPLGGNRRGKARRYANLMVTMLLGGLWHGAAWTFVVWGLLHGFYLIVNHGWQALRSRTSSGPLPHAVAWPLTLGAVAFAWVFFRSPSFEHAHAMIDGLVGLNGLHGEALSAVVGPGKTLIVVIALVVALLIPNTQTLIDGLRPPALGESLMRWAWMMRWRPTLAWAAVAGILFVVALTQMSTRREFVYFQF
jgi:D-alanyl-lipoteichoic acid acyltransferase DltB (MBOAT superfamily)